MGGKSSSSSRSDNINTTNNTYTSTSEDNRVVTGTGGSALIARDGSSVTMVNNVLDGGAIAGAIDLAKSGRELASKDFAAVVNEGHYQIEQAYKSADKDREFLKETMAEVAKSNQQIMKDVGSVYQSAREQELTKDTAGTKQILTIAGFAVVGLAALQAMK